METALLLSMLKIMLMLLTLKVDLGEKVNLSVLDPSLALVPLFMSLFISRNTMSGGRLLLYNLASVL